MTTIFTTMLKCEVLPSGLVRTCRGVLAYTDNVFEPTFDEKTGKRRYPLSLCFPKYVDLSVLDAFLDKIAKARFGANYKKDYPKLGEPFHKTSDYPKMGIDPEEFPRFIRTGKDAKYGRPSIVNSKVETVTDADRDQVYPGRWARLSLSPFAYPKSDSQLKDTGGNRGLSLGLESVQLLEDGPRTVGRRSDPSADFEAVEVSGDASELFKGGA